MTTSRRLALNNGPHYGAGSGGEAPTPPYTRVNSYGMQVSANGLQITYNIDTNFTPNANINYNFAGANVEHFPGEDISGTFTLDANSNVVVVRNIDSGYQKDKTSNTIINLQLLSPTSNAVVDTAPDLVVKYQPAPIDATGGNVSTIEVSNVEYILHEFTTSSSFTVSSTANILLGDVANVLAVGGGGGGGKADGGAVFFFGAAQTWYTQPGGGGAGGAVEQANALTSTFYVGTHTVNVGAGGQRGGFDGANSNVLLANGSVYVNAYGGTGGTNWNGNNWQANGYLGGGGSGNVAYLLGGAGTRNPGGNGWIFTPSNVYSLYDGGTTQNLRGAGGGGAGHAQNVPPNASAGSLVPIAGIGGRGANSTITGTDLRYGGGGGGGRAWTFGPAGGGTGDLRGGGGSSYENPSLNIYFDGVDGKGGGGGGGTPSSDWYTPGYRTLGVDPPAQGGNGGSGVVYIRYQGRRRVLSL